MSKIAIVGSRKFPHLQEVREFVRMLPEGTVVITGGAAGVDLTAEKEARRCGLEVIVFRPKWRKHGKKAGPMRNAKIIAEADACAAFMNINIKSSGTKDSLKRAQNKGVPIWLFLADYEKVLCHDFWAQREKPKKPEPVNKALKTFMQKSAKVNKIKPVKIKGGKAEVIKKKAEESRKVIKSEINEILEKA